MHSKTLSKVIIQCTVHHIVHLQYTFSRTYECQGFWHGYGDKGRWVKYWARWDSWISPSHGLFSIGTCFETYEPFISLIFKFLRGRGKPWILNKLIKGYNCNVQVWHGIKLEIIFEPWKKEAACFCKTSVFTYMTLCHVFRQTVVWLANKVQCTNICLFYMKHVHPPFWCFQCVTV
jgi:hypothetical protein